MCGPDIASPVRIKYVSYGLANRFSDRIELHKDLKKYPKLFRFMLQHELDHTGKDFSFRDLWLDLTNWKMILETWKFMIRRPSTWKQGNPFYKTEEGTFIDWNLIIIYSIMVPLTIALIAGIIIILHSVHAI